MTIGVVELGIWFNTGRTTLYFNGIDSVFMIVRLRELLLPIGVLKLRTPATSPSWECAIRIGNDDKMTTKKTMADLRIGTHGIQQEVSITMFWEYVSAAWPEGTFAPK